MMQPCAGSGGDVLHLPIGIVLVDPDHGTMYSRGLTHTFAFYFLYLAERR